MKPDQRARYDRLMFLIFEQFRKSNASDAEGLTISMQVFLIIAIELLQLPEAHDHVAAELRRCAARLTMYADCDPAALQQLADDTADEGTA